MPVSCSRVSIEPSALLAAARTRSSGSAKLPSGFLRATAASSVFSEPLPDSPSVLTAARRASALGLVMSTCARARVSASFTSASLSCASALRSRSTASALPLLARSSAADRRSLRIGGAQLQPRE